jgi:hypothetical protein
MGVTGITTHGVVTMGGIMITIVGAIITITINATVSLTGKRGILPNAISLVGGLYQTISGGATMVD